MSKKGNKKSVKMDLGSFLTDESFGGTSWADEEVDMSSIGVSIDKPSSNASTSYTTNTSMDSNNEGGYERRERKEFPIPDNPPFKARISNLPWEFGETDLIRFFEDRMQNKEIIQDIKLPIDRETNRLRGYGFITFKSKELLEESLNLTLSEFQGRKIFVNVAPPRDEDSNFGRSSGNRVELDWGAARSSTSQLPPRDDKFSRDRSERGERPERRRKEEPSLDWESARSTTSSLPPREDKYPPREDRGDRPPRRRKEESNLDWGAARSTTSQLPPREDKYSPREDRGDKFQRRNRNETSSPTSASKEQDFDWNRGQSLPQKQRSISASSKPKEDNLDWSSARSTTTTLPPRERSNRRNNNSQNKPESLTSSTSSSKEDFDWSRGQSLPQRTPRSKPQQPKESKKEEDSKQRGPQASQFSVLSIDDDEEEEEEEEDAEEEQKE
ncbi:TIF3 [Candida jiufengensis]|uniref:TIF3 n=1 Tax=Candida jiufengensis TaxID=497108 RepID=UPI002223FAEE|nr:TIF3 [Candida jiufengensis]KAI5956822.1 TIF3 [Candida jiufengensis]